MSGIKTHGVTRPTPVLTEAETIRLLVPGEVDGDAPLPGFDLTTEDALELASELTRVAVRAERARNDRIERELAEASR